MVIGQCNGNPYVKYSPTAETSFTYYTYGVLIGYRTQFLDNNA